MRPTMALLLFLAPAPVLSQGPGSATAEIRFLDVGQGDAIVVRVGASTVLIDAGPPADGIVNRLHALGVDSLEALIASHNHGDHIGSAGDVLRLLTVKRFIDNGVPLATPSEQRVADALRVGGILSEHAPRRTLFVGDVEFQIIPPPLVRDTAQNNRSLVVLIHRGRFRALLTGDSERSEIEALLRTEHLPPVTLLKAPHHGDPEALTTEWLRRLSPELVVVSVGAGNLTAADERVYLHQGRSLYRTDRDGDVSVLVDSVGAYRVTTSHAVAQ